MIYAEMTGTDIALIVVGAILVVALITLLVLVIVYFRRRRREEREERNTPTETTDKALEQIEKIAKDINDSINKQNVDNAQILSNFQKNITESVDKKVSEMQKSVNEKLDSNTKNMGETFTNVSKELQKLADTSKNLESLQGDVISLRDIFNNTQTRGQFGEHQLTAILENMFGENRRIYDLQYDIVLNDGTKIRPDAVLFLTHGLILCIDSKFPLESYRKFSEATDENEKKAYEKAFYEAVKGHIDTVSEKYVIEGITYQQALLFVPSDGIYTFLNEHNPEIWDYAYKEHVTLVSPSIIGPVLAGILMLRREEMMNEDAVRINQELINLSAQFKAFGEAWEGVSRRISGLNKAKGTLNTSVKEINEEFKQIRGRSGELLENKDAIDNDELSNKLKEIATEDDDDDE